MSKNTNKKPLILALETSGRIGSVAIAAGGQLLAEKTFSTPVKHSAELFPAITQLLTDFNKTPDDIEHIYISIGPGSFTGLRLAVTFAKIMHLANPNIKIVAVDTLDVIAANATDYFQSNPPQKAGTISCILDAKRSRFFIAAYRITSVDKPPEKILDDKLWTPQQFFDNFAVSNKSLLLLGEGLVYYRNLFKHNNNDFLDEKYWYPTASKVYSIGHRLAKEGCFSDPLSLTPRYIQSPDTDNL
jgi:tRNA threonylcarbamoyladenosine biosynthesis protein TsaB